jgi:hypothetical protein
MTDELTPEALAFCQQRGVMETKASEIIASKEPAVYKAIQEGIELRPTPTPRGSRSGSFWTETSPYPGENWVSQSV